MYIVLYFRCLIVALDAMRKAYEEDLEVEKEKYRVAIKTMYTEEFVNEIKHRHE